MPPANAATIAGLLILLLLLRPTAFGASLLLPTTAVSRITALGPRDDARAVSGLPDAAAEGRTASPTAGEEGAGTSAASGCASGQGTGSSHDTGFWRDVPDTSHDDDFGHDVPDTAHDRGFAVDACDLADPAFGTPVAGPPSPSLADQAIMP
jgi:hypothetical protein